jgi:hypothetical protein
VNVSPPVNMLPILSIRIPQSPIAEGYHARRLPVPVAVNYYKSWTPSDYAAAYGNANETTFTWDNVEIPRRSPRLVNKSHKSKY